MSNEELQQFLAWSRNPQSFSQLSDEWKAWAKATILSVKVDVSGTRQILQNDAVSYLCQIMVIFESLCKGITEDDLRGKFVSGLVACGFPPEKDASTIFKCALLDAQNRGLVTYRDVGWGNEEERFFQVELAGKRLADSIPISSAVESPEKEQYQGTQPNTTSSSSSALPEPKTGLAKNKTDQQEKPDSAPQRWCLFYRGSSGSRLIDGECDPDVDEDTIQGLNEWHLFDCIDDLTSEEVDIMFKVLDADHQGVLAEEDSMLNGEIRGRLYEFNAVAEEDVKKDQVEWIRLQRKWSDLEHGYEAFGCDWTNSIETEHALWESSKRTADQIRLMRVQEADSPCEPVKTPDTSTPSCNGTSQPTLTVGIATIIMACKSLQLLDEIRRLYPRAISDDETAEIFKQTTEAVEFWLSQGGDSMKGCCEVYRRPTPEQLINEETMVVMSVAGMIATDSEHPELDGRLEKVFRQSQLMAAEPVQSILKRLVETQTFDCREVDLKAGPEYADPRRALFLLGEYCGVLRTVVIAESQAMLYHVPHPLTPVLVNLRERIHGCFDRMENIAGKDDAKDAMDWFLACLLESDGQELQAAEEYCNRQLAQTELFIQEAKLLIGRKTFDLTFAEHAFFNVARKVAERYTSDVKSQVKGAEKFFNSPEVLEIQNARRAAAESYAAKTVGSEVIGENTTAEEGGKTTAKKRGGGRKKSPKIQARNKNAAADLCRGLDVDAVTEKYGISAALARRIKSDAGKGKYRKS